LSTEHTWPEKILMKSEVEPKICRYKETQNKPLFEMCTKTKEIKVQDLSIVHWYLIWWPSEKFVDSPYYFESELCGGAMTVSFSKYLPWQAMHFLQRSTHFSKRAADRWSLRNVLPWSFLFMVGKAQKSHGVRSGLYGGCSKEVPLIHFFQAEHRI
jgi:hypothetical protein